MFKLLAYCLAASMLAPQVFAKEQLFIVKNNKAGAPDIQIKDISEFKLEIHHKVVSPHPSLNPKKEEHTWSGFLIRSLFPKMSAEDQASPITFVASDGYSVEIPARDVVDNDVIISTHVDGEKQPMRKGGPQIVYPSQSKKLPEKYHKDLHWAFYVSSVVLGEPNSFVKIAQEKTSEKNVDLGPLSSKCKSEKSKIQYPTGNRDEKPPSQMNTTSCTLDKMLENLDLKTKTNVKVSSLSGRTMTITPADFDKYDVVFRWDSKPISPLFGGPVQICRQGKQPACFYHVYRIDL